MSEETRASRVVFLDIDGVLNSATWHEMRPRRGEMPPAERWFDPAAVTRLNRLTDETGACIVISSSWRQYGEDYMRDLLRRVGVTAPIVGCTPILDDGSIIMLPVPRGKEIQAWLDGWHTKPEAFVILDDEADMAHLRRHLVRTSHAVGLTDDDVEMALYVLGRAALRAAAGGGGA